MSLPQIPNPTVRDLRLSVCFRLEENKRFLARSHSPQVFVVEFIEGTWVSAMSLLYLGYLLLTSDLQCKNLTTII